MNYMNAFYPESRIGGFTDLDGTIAFYTRVGVLTGSASVVLDVGCGRGEYADDPVSVRRELRIFRGRCAKVIGIDVDPGAEANPFIDEFRPIESQRWCIDDQSVDTCICDTVLEHVEDPDRFFSEAARVIRPGGHLCLRTPNVLSYFGLLSKLIPNKRHAAVLAKVQTHRAEEDVFPTLYRCNTRARLRAMFRKHRFDAAVYGYEAEPSYLSFSKFAYALGVLHQKFAPNALKVSLMAFGRKLPAPRAASGDSESR
ncbi:MAG: class I SAM-dependent methyltransferase [Phycisphaerae bacterium]|jgi:SAM-dependent methyltransferase|nr:class I SAM-dependent methyltransferase [Phycisphaerae bacterium]